MDTEKFLAAYNASRNGCNERYRHPLVRRFVYSDGVKDCAEAGCYWLLDIIATEVMDIFKKQTVSMGFIGFVRVDVADSKATIFLDRDENEQVWSRAVDYTDMPDGRYTFMITDEGDHCFLILMSEY